MLKILNSEMRMPALAAAACAAVMLVASPVSAATAYTSADYRDAMVDTCTAKNTRTKGTCMQSGTAKYREFKATAALAYEACLDAGKTQEVCNADESAYWQQKISKLK